MFRTDILCTDIRTSGWRRCAVKSRSNITSAWEIWREGVRKFIAMTSMRRGSYCPVTVIKPYNVYRNYPMGLQCCYLFVVSVVVMCTTSRSIYRCPFPLYCLLVLGFEISILQLVTESFSTYLSNYSISQLRLLWSSVPSLTKQCGTLSATYPFADKPKYGNDQDNWFKWLLQSFPHHHSSWQVHRAAAMEWRGPFKSVSFGLHTF